MEIGKLTLSKNQCYEKESSKEKAKKRSDAY